MTASDKAILAARMKAEAQQDRAMRLARVILDTARTYGLLPLEAYPTNDTERFRVWRMAKCVSAPSEETWALCRKIVSDATPPLSIVPPEFRDQLEQLERQRQVGMEVWKP